ncbi:MAG TPA: hypothetical protein VGX71_13630 [Pseudaminobacter sp.]|nr:hypothetical protein [Pseudaminobacter sp.]
MAYETSNPPKCVLSGFGGSASLYVYTDGDAHGTVSGAAYFANGKDLGMKIGDVVIVQNTTGYTTTTHSVSAVSAAGAATVSAAVLA